jgi:hypothetical protein
MTDITDRGHGPAAYAEFAATVEVATGLFGRLTVAADPAQADEIRELAAQAAAWATRARGEGTLRAYRSASRCRPCGSTSPRSPRRTVSPASPLT